MSLDWLREGMLSASGNKIHVIIIKVFWLIYLCRRVFKIKLVSWNGKHRGAIACQQNSIIEMLRWKKNGQGHCAPLTIMFSKACLASQQFKKTGMKRFLKDGKITCREKKKCLGLLSSYRSAFICYTVMVSGSKGGSVHLGISSRFQVLDSDVWFFFFIGGWDYSAWSPKQMAACRDSPCRQCSVMRILPLTVIMKGTALIISRMKGTRSTCSQTLPWKHKPHTGVRKLHCLGDLRRLTHNRPSYHKVQGNKLMSFCTIQ